MAKTTDTTIRLDHCDLFGAVVSVACVVHCLLAPLWMVAVPTVQSVWTRERVHHHVAGGWMDVAFLALSAGAVWYATRQASSGGIRAWLWGGWVLLALGLWLHLHHAHWGQGLMYAGSSVQIVAHLLRYRHRRVAARHHQSYTEGDD